MRYCNWIHKIAENRVIKLKKEYLNVSLAVEFFKNIINKVRTPELSSCVKDVKDIFCNFHRSREVIKIRERFDKYLDA